MVCIRIPHTAYRIPHTAYRIKSATISPMPTVLHVLSQRPGLTGSGVTLDALVRNAGRAGWDQHVVVGVPEDDPEPEVGGLSKCRVHPLGFGTSALPFPVPGMSDVMPYPSTRFSTMDRSQVNTYIEAWRSHLGRVISATSPDIIHSHHVWLMSSIIKDVAPQTPVFTHCHATGLRQMELCPDLSLRVRQGCGRIDGFGVLHQGHADQLVSALSVPADRIGVIGAGFRDELFHARGRREPAPRRILFIGKYSHSKGLPSLLDACQRLIDDGRNLELHIAGSGSGAEADELRSRMDAMAPSVVLHGQLAQPELANVMRESSVCVLPSFYEGLPLVLVEAFACGCRLVATALPGITEQLAPALDDALELIELPSMAGVDTPVAAELPAFSAHLCGALDRALAADPLGDPAVTRPDALAAFTWDAVFERVEAIWHEMLGG